MISLGSRAFHRLSQLTLPCIENRRIAPLSWSSERVLAFYSTSLARTHSDSQLRSSLIAPIAHRAYATAKPVSRPKAHTGRTTTSPRKKADPKKAVPEKTTSKTAAAKKPAVAKSKAARKPTKAKKKAKSKKPKAKPKAKPKKRKVLTDAQKAKLVVAKEKLALQKLKELALTPPKGLRSTAWMAVHNEAISEKAPTTKVGQTAKTAAIKYKNLTPEELEHYNHVANQSKAKAEANYRQWIESHTPDQIRLANNARRTLRRRTGKNWPHLQDERQVKGPITAYLLFYADRRKSGDFHGINIVEASRLAAREWKALSADERKKYFDMAAQDMARYEQEQKAVYNRDVVHTKAPSASS